MKNRTYMWIYFNLLILTLIVILGIPFVDADILNYSGTDAPHIRDYYPLDGTGNEIGGLNAYCMLGDFMDYASTYNNASSRCVFVFNNLTSYCPLGVSYSYLHINEYLVEGNKINSMNISLLNKTTSSLANADFQNPPEDVDFNTSFAIWSTGWKRIDVSRQINTSISSNFSFIAFRLRPNWYDNDNTNDVAYFYSSGSNKPYLNYSCYTTTTTLLPIVVLWEPQNASSHAVGNVEFAANITNGTNSVSQSMLWGNFSGVWAMANYSNTFVNGTCNFSYGLTFGTYLFTFAVNDSANNWVWGDENRTLYGTTTTTTTIATTTTLGAAAGGGGSASPTTTSTSTTTTLPTIVKKPLMNKLVEDFIKFQAKEIWHAKRPLPYIGYLSAYNWMWFLPLCVFVYVWLLNRKK